MHESERLHPVAFVVARIADRPFEAGGYQVRQGPMILVSPAVAHRLPEHYPEPDEYADRAGWRAGRAAPGS